MPVGKKPVEVPYWQQFRKKPVVIEAVRWFKYEPSAEVGPEVAKYHVRFNQHYVLCQMCHAPYNKHGWIETLEGGHIVCPGDWIIKGVKGEFYPCKPDIFEMTYEPVG